MPVITFQRFVFPILLSICCAVVSCSKDEDQTNTSESDYREAEEVAHKFYASLLNHEFSKALAYSDKASFQSIKKIERYKEHALTGKMISIDTCVHSEGIFKCACTAKISYRSYDFKDTITVYKYGTDDFRAHYVLGMTNECSMLYDLSLKKIVVNDELLKNKQIKDEVAALGAYLYETACKLNYGYDNASYIQNLPFYSNENVKNGIKFATKNIEMSVKFSFSNLNVINACEVRVESSKYNTASIQNAFCIMFKQYFGKPFNARHLHQDNYVNYEELRWFVNDFNTVMEVEYFPGYLNLRLKETW